MSKRKQETVDLSKKKPKIVEENTIRFEPTTKVKIVVYDSKSKHIETIYANCEENDDICAKFESLSIID